MVELRWTARCRLVVPAAVVCLLTAACQSPPASRVETPSPAPTLSQSFAACGSLQARVRTAAPGSVIDLSGCRVTGGATIDKPLTIRGGQVEAEAGSFGILVSSSNVNLDGVSVIGQQAAAYVSDEIGIRVEGTIASPVRNVVLRDCTVSNLGYGGIYIQYADGFALERNTITDGVYAGIMILSGQNGSISGNTVLRIGVRGSDANGGNAYGIALSRGTGDVSESPPTSAVTVSANTVEDVPTWHAFDGHGVAGVTWQANTARGSRFGFFITGSLSTGGMLRALDNNVVGNTVLAPAQDAGYAIVSVYSTGGAVRDNTTSGWTPGHELLTTSAGDPNATAVGLAVSGNQAQP